MQQYFVTPEQIAQRTVTFQREDAHHIAHVMRMKVEQHILVVSEGIAYRSQLTQITPTIVQAQLIEQLSDVRELSSQITIVLALLKADKMEYALQKLTELGMHEFIPWSAQYSITKLDSKKETKKLTRFASIIKEAAKQSKRLHIPTLQPVHTTKELCHKMATYDVTYIASERLDDRVHRIQQVEATKQMIIIGPEGGIAESEMTLFLQQESCYKISLGNRILRAETAAMCAMSLFAAKDEQII